jgi:hypothetical protein
VATCFWLLAPLAFVSVASGAFPCEDVNNNGVCDPGEPDITADLLTGGSFSTTESIVIPEDVKRLTTKDVAGFVLVAGQNLAIYADLQTVAQGAGISLVAQDGTINVGKKVDLKTGKDGFIDLAARGDITLAGASLKSDMVTLYSEEGNVLIEGSKLSGEDGVEITALSGEVTVNSKSQLRSKNGDMRVDADGNATVNGIRIMANVTSVQSGADIDFSDNRVAAPGDGGAVLLTTFGSMVNVCGTRYKNIDPENVFIQGDELPC